MGALPSRCGPAGEDRSKEGMQDRAANPGVDSEPATSDQRAHQRRQVGAIGAVACAQQHRKRNPIPRPGMTVEEDRNQHDHIAEQDRTQRLQPRHSGVDESRRQHVRRNAVRHRDPQRSKVVGGPVPLREGNRRQIGIVQGALLQRLGVLFLKLDAPISVVDLGHVSACFAGWSG
jgi:hypothetical protein